MALKRLTSVRRSIPGACVLILIAAGIMAIPFFLRHWGPRLSIVDRTINLGIVACQAKQGFTFEARNTGMKTLELAVGSVSCGCTVFEIPKKTLEPGEVVQLSGRISAPDQPDSFGADIILTSNDTSQKQVVLKVRGTSAPLLSFEPPTLYFGSRTTVELPISKTIHIKPGELANVRTLANATVSSDDDAITVKTRLDKGELIAEIALTSSLPVGVARGNLMVHVRDPIEQDFRIPIAVELLGKCRAEPGVLLFGRISEPNPTALSCRLLGIPTGAAVKIEGPKVANDALRFEVQKSESEVVVLVTLTPPASRIPISEDIFVNVTSANGFAERMRIPVMAIFR